MSNVNQPQYVVGAPVVVKSKSRGLTSLHSLGTAEIVFASIGFVLLFINAISTIVRTGFTWQLLVNQFTLGGIPLLVSGIYARRLSDAPSSSLICVNRCLASITLTVTVAFTALYMYTVIVLASISGPSLVVLAMVMLCLYIVACFAILIICIAHLAICCNCCSSCPIATGNEG